MGGWTSGDNLRIKWDGIIQHNEDPSKGDDLVRFGFIMAGGAGDIWVEKAGDTMTGLLTHEIAATNNTFQNFTIGGTSVGSIIDTVGLFAMLGVNELFLGTAATNFALFTASTNTWTIVTTGGLTLAGTATLSSWLDVGTGFATGVTNITDDLAATKVHSTIIANAVSNNITVNLAAASTMNRFIHNIKKTDSSSNTVTIDPSGSETIDGATTLVIPLQYDSITIQSDGTEWWII